MAEIRWSKNNFHFQRQRSPDYEELERRPVPPSFTTIPPSSSASSRRYDYDEARRLQEREDDIYRRRLLLEQQAAAASQVFGDFFYGFILFFKDCFGDYLLMEIMNLIIKISNLAIFGFISLKIVLESFIFF